MNPKGHRPRLDGVRRPVGEAVGQAGVAPPSLGTELLRVPGEGDRGADTPAEGSLPPVSPAELPMLVLALLLVAPDGAPLGELARAAGVPVASVEAALLELDALSQAGGDAAWLLQRHGTSVQLTTAPRFAPYVRRFLGLEREAKLSSAAIETLAIIAYQQPITRAEIEAVRGVDSSGVLATLHSRGLIEQVGRVQAPGNPVQYGTTARFLQHFGLASLADLPPLGRIEGQDAHQILQEAIAVKHHAPDRDTVPESDRGPLD